MAVGHAGLLPRQRGLMLRHQPCAHYDAGVRTTITLDDDTAALLQQHMRRRGLTLKQAVNDALRQALGTAGPRPTFVTRAVDMGEPVLPMDRALALAADLEDEELLRKAAQRK